VRCGGGERGGRGGVEGRGREWWHDDGEDGSGERKGGGGCKIGVMVEKEVVVRLQLWHDGDNNDEVVKKEESGDIIIMVKEMVRGGGEIMIVKKEVMVRCR